MATYRPLEPKEDQYTRVDNYLFDHIMPVSPPNAWKVICFIVRKTRGWVDRETGERKSRDRLSYSQIMKGTGIKHPKTVSTAIQFLVTAKYVLAFGSKGEWEANEYELNTAFEVEIPTSKNEPTSKSEAVATSKNEAGSTSKNEDTKESVKERKEKRIHIEKPNSGFSRVSFTEHPQAQQPTKRTTKQAPLSSQSALFESPPSVSVEPLPSQPQVPQQQRKPDAMYDAICLAWKTEGGMAGKIQQQLLGKMPKKHPHHASNFAEPATPDEVASFAKWYKNRYPGCDMPMSPEKIQHHFAAFRRETGEAAKKNTPKIREQNGRRLKYDSTLQSWLDIGPAQVPSQSSNRSQNEAYAQ